MILINCGDSWAHGTELVHPDDRVSDNYSTEWEKTGKSLNYRQEHRYIKLFGNKVNATKIVDLSIPGTSNDTIVRQLFRWLSSYGYIAGKDTSELFVNIGWTSPERKDFCYKDRLPGENGRWITFYPLWKHDYAQSGLNDFRDLYITNFWTTEEYMHRWIMQVWQIQMLLKSLNIKYVMHQAFYHHHKAMIHEWDDNKYIKNNHNQADLRDIKIWNCVDPITFMHKNEPETGTFHNYITKKTKEKVLYVNHPNELGHIMWADHMYEYCKEFNIL